MDKLGRTSRWEKPFEPYRPECDGELLLALKLIGHMRRRPGIATSYLGALERLKKYHTVVLPKLHAAKLITYHRSLRDHHNARYRDMEWMPTKKGNRWYEHRILKYPALTYEPRRGLNSWYPHASGCSLIGASIDLSAVECPGLIVSYYAHQPQVYDHLEPDEPPFFIKYITRIDVAGIEYDRATMSLVDFGEKLRKWNRYYFNKHYERHEMKAPYTLVISNSAWRTQALRDLAVKIIDPRFHGRFLFKTIPDFKSNELPPATGFIVLEPWQTVDGGSFNIPEEIGCGHREVRGINKAAAGNRPADTRGGECRAEAHGPTA